MINIADIKIKEIKDKTVKSLDKTIAWTERVKDPIVYLNDKSKDSVSNDTTISEYGEDKIKYYTNRAKDESIYQGKKVVNKTSSKLKNEYQKKKLARMDNKVQSEFISKRSEITKNGIKNSKQTVRTTKQSIKNTKQTIKNTERITKETAKASKRMLEQGRKLTIKTAKGTARATKTAIKITISTVKAIIAAAKSLIAAIIAGGTTAFLIILVVCIIGLLLTSIFSIFFSNEGESRTMTSVVSQVNTEVYKKAEDQKFFTHADDIIVQSTNSNWKEVIAVYSVKNNKNDETDDTSIVMYLNDKNVSKLKNVFYDFNTVKVETREETIEEEVESEEENKLEFNPNIQQPFEPVRTEPKKKKIVYLNVESKSLDQIMNQYKFNDEQKEQVKELLDKQYDDLWLNLIYGNNAGEFVFWRQKNAPWSNIQMGNSGGTIGKIGCLVTSISMLIEKSGVNNTIIPFNPGTFVEALNKNNGFDEKGNLQYSAVNKAVPNFEYVGRVELKGKTQNEKYNKIKEYQDKGYYLSVEVKGNTGQHWVTILNVDNTITIADPASDGTSLWSTYNWENTSQFVYFKTK